MSDTSRTLIKNSIKSFILRIDVIKTDQTNLALIAEKMSAYFDRTEKRQISNFTVNFTSGNSEISKNDFYDFVLISEAKNISMTFSEVQNAFWIECSQYKNSSTYKELITKLLNILKELSLNIESKRIGMRYINDFDCNGVKNISKIYNKRLTSIVRNMLFEKTQSRIIGMEEYNNDGYKLRLQYGIPNKYYPSIITVFNLLLDIDSYIESTNTVDEWEEIIKNLNHAAYNKFKIEINENYIAELK